MPCSVSSPLASQPDAPQPPAPPPTAAPSESATAVAEPPAREATSPKPAPPKPRLDHLPPFKVLLHNDDSVEMNHVVHTLLELTPLTRPSAIEVMLEAHTRGVALVLTTHQERAELYAQQLHSKGLTSTIEPA